MEHQKPDIIIEEILLYLKEKNYKTSPYKVVNNKPLIFNTLINKVKYTITVHVNKNFQVQPYNALYSEKLTEELNKSNLMDDEILGEKVNKLFKNYYIN